MPTYSWIAAAALAFSLSSTASSEEIQAPKPSLVTDQKRQAEDLDQAAMLGGLTTYSALTGSTTLVTATGTVVATPFTTIGGVGIGAGATGLALGDVAAKRLFGTQILKTRGNFTLTGPGKFDPDKLTGNEWPYTVHERYDESLHHDMYSVWGLFSRDKTRAEIAKEGPKHSFRTKEDAEAWMNEAAAKAAATKTAEFTGVVLAPPPAQPVGVYTQLEAGPRRLGQTSPPKSCASYFRDTQSHMIVVAKSRDSLLKQGKTREAAEMLKHVYALMSSAQKIAANSDQSECASISEKAYHNSFIPAVAIQTSTYEGSAESAR